MTLRPQYKEISPYRQLRNNALRVLALVATIGTIGITALKTQPAVRPIHEALGHIPKETTGACLEYTSPTQAHTRVITCLATPLNDTEVPEAYGFSTQKVGPATLVHIQSKQ